MGRPWEDKIALSHWRALARGALGSVLWPVTARLLSGRTGGARGLILMFHHVGPPILPGAEDYLFLSEAQLGRVLDFVAAELRPLAPFDFLERLAAGTLPPRATLLTFDDGTLDQATVAAPAFLRRGLRACFFVCPGLIEAGATVPTLELASICRAAASGAAFPTANGAGDHIRDAAARVRAFWAWQPALLRTPSRERPAWLAALRAQVGAGDAPPGPYPLATWQQLDALAAAGMVIANHTLYHSTISADGPAQFAADVAAAFAVLDARYPLPRRIFCYPYGRAADATPEAEEVLRAQGVDAAFVVQGGLARPALTSPLALHREAVAYGVGATRLATLLACWR